MRKIISLLLLISLLAGLMAACASEDDEEINILEDDLSKYIELDEKYYKGYTVVVDPNRVTDFHINNEIIAVLCKNKSKEAIDGDGIISVGDVVDIYYKGYYFNEDGSKNYFDGGSNVGASSPHSLEIGSHGFIPGFEYNLIGKNPAEYTTDNPIVVETFFPENYQAAELAGKTAYFEVTVVKITEYSAPELDEAFIKDTLKLETALADYEGENLVEKYRAYVKEEYILDNGLDEESLIYNAFWKSVIDGAVVKKYPETLVKQTADEYAAELKYYYENSYSYYYEYEQFMCLYLGLEIGSDWQAELEEIAKNQIKQQMIIYHIMNKEGLRPTAAKYEELFDEYLTDALNSEGITPENYGTNDEYLAVKNEYKTQMLKQQGEEYFKSMIYYGVVWEKVKGYANIVDKAE